MTNPDIRAGEYAEIARLKEELRDIKELVNEQADEEALWFKPTLISEAYLQEALRRLHRRIEEAIWRI